MDSASWALSCAPADGGTGAVDAGAAAVAGEGALFRESAHAAASNVSAMAEPATPIRTWSGTSASPRG